MKTNKFWSILMMFVLVLGATFTFSSCGDDDKDVPTPETEEEDVNVEIAQCAGYWECISSTDKIAGKTYNNLIKGKTLHIKRDGEYGSSSDQLGEGEINKIGSNTFEINNHSGDKYTIKVVINGEKMIWSGAGSGPSTDYAQVVFEYTFQKTDSGNGGSSETYTDDIAGQYLKTVVQEELYYSTLSSKDEYDYTYINGKISKYQTDFDAIVSSDVSGSEWIFNFEKRGRIVRYSKVSYDGTPYVTSFTVTRETDESENSTKYGFTYNQNGQLTEIYSQEVGGQSRTIRINWSNDNISKVVFYSDSNPDGYRTYTYTYGNQVNRNNQMPNAVPYVIFNSQIDDLELIRGLALIGKFGKAPKNLPNSYSQTGMAISTETYTIDYTLNTNGNIKEETFNYPENGYRKFIYSYK